MQGPPILQNQDNPLAFHNAIAKRLQLLIIVNNERIFLPHAAIITKSSVAKQPPTHKLRVSNGPYPVGRYPMEHVTKFMRGTKREIFDLPPLGVSLKPLR